MLKISFIKKKKIKLSDCLIYYTILNKVSFETYYVKTEIKNNYNAYITAICKPRHLNLGVGIGIGTDIINVIISSSVRPMGPKLIIVVT